MAVSDFLPQGTQLKGASSFLPQNTQLGGASSFLPGAKQKTDLTTSAGLYAAAQQMGLQEQADKVLLEKGEQTKTFYSGGFVSDIFDSLNVLQYGIVGLIKGKSFKEGVKTRQSFSDQDALGDFGIPGTIAGIALDIAVDPLTYIAPWTIAKKIPGITKAAKAIKAGLFGKITTKGIKTAKGIKKMEVMEGGTRVGRWFSSRFVNRFGQDPVYKLADQRRIKNIAIGTRNIMDLTKPLSEIDPVIANKVLMRGAKNRIIRRPIEQIRKLLPADAAKKAIKLGDSIDEKGKILFKLTGAPMETYREWQGKYIANLYEEFEKAPGIIAKVVGVKKIGYVGKRLKKAHLTDLAKRKELGEIVNAPYLLARTNIELIKDIENLKLLNLVSKKLSTNVAQEGFKQLPKVARLGKLSEGFVPAHIFDSIQEITKIKGPTEKALNKVVAGFKFGKVVMNPATQARNVVSNTLLNWWKLGLGPWRLDKYASATKSWIKHDDLFKRALTQAGDFHTYAREEMMNMLLGPEGLSAGKKVGKAWKTVVRKMGNTYQASEGIAKLAAFKHMLGKGLSDDAAWKLAEKATFNYAEVTPFIRKLRESIWGLPFITFTTKVTPLAIETALKHPYRISAIGKVKNAIENMADIEMTARERASEPAWVRNGFYIKLPIKDKHGRSSYLDLSYILPFGDLISGDFMEPQVSRVTGLKEGVIPALSRKSPFINVIRELTSNQDFYGNKIFRESDTSEKQIGDVFRHLTKTYLPPLVADQIPGGYDYKGERRPTALARTRDVEGTQRRTLMQEMLRNVGLKIQPIDIDIQETYMEWEKKKALETLLTEKGPLREFSRSYIPQ